MRARKRGRGGAGALLAVLVLSLCFLMTRGQIVTTTTISVNPPNPVEGGNVSLIPEGVPADPLTCRWFRGGDATANTILVYFFFSPPTLNPGANYTGRETIDSKCSLHITNLAGNYSGTYKFLLEGRGGNIKGEVELLVSEVLSPPILTPKSYLPLEKEKVTLKCNTSSSASVSWQKDGKAELPGNVVLSENNRTLTISDFSQKDNGTYTCVASNPLFKETSNPSVLSMAYGPNNVKINSTRNLTVGLDSTVSLLCSADSNPEAQFLWFVNNTAKNVTKPTYNIASVTWENAGDYRCLASNFRTNQTGTFTVTIIVQVEKPDNPDNPGGLSGGAIAGIVIGCLAAVVLIAGLIYYICAKTSVGRTERHASNGTVPSAPGHNQGATDSKPRTGDEDVQYSTLAFNASHPPQPAPVSGQPSDGVTIYSEIRKK